MSIEAHELTFIVDETHEDPPCGRETEPCSREAVVWVIWIGCSHCPRRVQYCLPHWERFWIKGPKGRPTSRCSRCLPDSVRLEVAQYGRVTR